jgi:DNA-binding helix-hairpin-helix protein with protein kinase domain
VIIAAGQNSEVTVQPIVLALIPILSVLLTVLSGLVGAWIQNRREHKKWVRERRFEAYIALSELVHAMETERDVVQDIAAKQARAFEALRQLGEKSVSEGEKKYLDAERAKVNRDLEQISERLDRARQNLLKMLDEWGIRKAPVSLLGTTNVKEAASLVFDVKLDKKARINAIVGLERAMRQSLGIRQ